MSKILFVISVDWTFVSHRLHLAEKALNDGYDVAILTKFTDYRKFIESKGIKTYTWNFSRKSLSPLNAIISIFELWKTIIIYRPNLIHSVAIKPVIYTGLIKKFYKKFSFVGALGGLGFIFSSEKTSAKLLKILIKFLLSFSLSDKKNKLILQNRDDEKIILNSKLVKKEQVFIIKGSGVEIEKFYPSKFPQNVPIILLPCRLLWDKGVREFLICAKNIKEKGINVRFVIVGQIDKENPESISRKEIENWENENLIEYWGKKNNMQSIYSKSNIICFPSYREGMPKALLEAASCARPIIAFDVPGSREVVRNNFNGLLVPFKNVSLLEKSILSLLNNRKTCISFGKNGRKLVAKEFSDTKIYEETIKVWNEILKKKYI